MIEKEVKKCPKCDGEMEKGARITCPRGMIPLAVTFAKERDVYGDKIIPFWYRKYGYIELYKTPGLKEKYGEE